MLLEQTVDKLVQMKLFGMANSIKTRLERPDHSGLSLTDILGLIVDDEWIHRENRKMTIRLKQARFKDKNACIEDIDYQHSRDLQKTTVLDLAQSRWIDASQNLAITGPTGVGKSYIAQALGHQACRAGHATAYLRVPKLMNEITHAKGDGTYARYLARLSKMKLLILDDLGITVLSEDQRRDFLEVIEDRYSTGSVIITSQLPTTDWYVYFGGGVVADAICDRLLHNCHRIELKGESVRKAKAQKPVTEEKKEVVQDAMASSEEK